MLEIFGKKSGSSNFRPFSCKLYRSIFLLQTHCAPCSTIRKKTNARFLSDCFLKAQPALLHQYNPRHNLEENILQKGKLAYLTSFCYVSQILTPILLQRNATKNTHLNKVCCCCQKRPSYDNVQRNQSG